MLSVSAGRWARAGIRRRPSRVLLFASLLAALMVTGAVASQVQGRAPGVPSHDTSSSQDQALRTAHPSTSRTTAGSLTVTQDGTVVDGVHVRGAINVQADDVTIIRSTVTYSGSHSIRVFGGAEGTRIVDTTIECEGQRTNGVVFGNYVAERVRTQGCRNAFLWSDAAPAVVRESSVDGADYSSTGEEAVRVPTDDEGHSEDSTPSARTSLSTPAAADDGHEPSNPPERRDGGPPSEAARDAVIEEAGPRTAPVEVLSAEEAQARVSRTGRLDAVRVQGSLDLSGVTRSYVVSDVVVDAGGAPYGIRTLGGTSEEVRPSGPQVLEHIEVHGASSAGLYLRDVTVRHADLWGNIDNVKADDRVHMTYSWLHDQSWRDGAHADAIQIQAGVDQYYAHNVIDAHFGDAEVAGRRAGQPSNAALQTGSMTGEASAQFVANFFDGGYYTVRLGASGPPVIDYQFRDNVFGRGFTYGPVTGSAGAPSGLGGVFLDDSNIWEDTRDSL